MTQVHLATWFRISKPCFVNKPLSPLRLSYGILLYPCNYLLPPLCIVNLAFHTEASLLTVFWTWACLQHITNLKKNCSSISYLEKINWYIWQGGTGMKCVCLQ
jgi:hypothetical protein